MKTYASTILTITICTLTFLSCSKKKESTPPQGKGSVVFWTKNAALLTACSNNITIRLVVPNPYGSSILIDSAHIISANASAPSSCSNTPSAIENVYAQFYSYNIKDCATGLWGNGGVFTLLTGECLKIEIP
jgi:hypothetical protein